MPLQEEVDDVRSLKRRLRGPSGTPRFRQRLLSDGQDGWGGFQHVLWGGALGLRALSSLNPEPLALRFRV